MEKHFKGYVPYRDQDYRNIWKNGLVVIDTNIILNFYRYSDATRNELWKILEDLEDKLWVPHQVCQEYFDNRINVIDKVEKSLGKIEEKINKQLEDSKKELQQVDKKDIKCKEEIIETINETKKKISKLILNEKKEQDNLNDNDAILQRTLKLFKNKCEGEETPEVLEKIKQEAKRREECKIPPGYKDNKKEENFGDYYIFYSMIKKAKQEKKDIIFITDDEKQDWYLIVNGMNRGGRPELLQEFYKETKQLIFICTTKIFLKSYSKFCSGNQAPRTVMQEIENMQNKEEDMLIQDRLFLRRSLSARDRMMLEKIRILRAYLIQMLENEDYISTNVDRFVWKANNIIEDMRFEKYHGKILIIVDELERNGISKETVNRCIYLLGEIRQEILERKYCA